jgi:acetyl esterase/lipase
MIRLVPITNTNRFPKTTLSVLFATVAIFPLFTFCIAVASGETPAQPNVWQPSPGHQQISIWPDAAPDAQPMPGPEKLETDKDGQWVTNVTRPTMTVYSPESTNTGAAVIVLPGGGFEGLAMDLEGADVCDWLTRRGITCVLLKYRVPSLPYDWRSNSRPDGYVVPTQALEDVQRAVGLVRSRAAEWKIDPKKIGVIGFSAGGYLVAEISTHFEHRLYAPVDEADKASCRPDFAMAIYPGHLAKKRGAGFDLNPNVPVTPQTPTTFLLQAEDDHVDGADDSLAYYMGLKKAGVPVEMHLYAQGGHAFGLKPSKFPISQWPRLAETWLKTIGVTGK